MVLLILKPYDLREKRITWLSLKLLALKGMYMAYAKSAATPSSLEFTVLLIWACQKHLGGILPRAVSW